MRRTTLALIVLLLAGCAGTEDGPTGSTATPAVEATAPVEDATEPVDDETVGEVAFEGSVTTEDGSFVEYPDGLVVRLVRMERMPPELAFEHPPGHAIIKAVLELDNTAGSAVVPLPEMSLLSTVYYGENRSKGDQEAGYASEPDTPKQELLNSQVPARVTPGTVVEYFTSWTVPENELATLAVEAHIDPTSYTPYVFTDAETLLASS